jgi:pimeloyl-ACP methyl ester carboxylesterase
MDNLRTYGSGPFGVALIHGGPGAPGELAPVARELATDGGVLEPLQTADSVDGQVRELRDILGAHGDLPVTLVGFSWGAWLVYITASRHPSLVRKLVLVSSGPFDESYTAGVTETRLSRLSPEERAEAASLQRALTDPGQVNEPGTLARFGHLMSKADSFDPLPHAGEGLDVDQRIFQQVWAEASALRQSGKLLEMGRKITCPVVAIHGDHDPHPAEGVREPLSRILPDFRFVLLENCGHTPWLERAARDAFYQTLRREL